MKYLLPLLLLLVIEYSASARLGETETQIEARYGKPTEILTPLKDNLPRKVYEKNGMEIIVSYINGKSCSEDYSHQGGDNAPPITSDEVAELLNKNSLDSDWILEKGSIRSRLATWHLKSGDAKAYYFGTDLALVTKECEKLQLEKDTFDKPISLKGF